MTIRKINLLILSLLYLENCHTFNQTKNITKKVAGETQIEIRKINRIEIDNNGDIQVIAEIRKARTTINFGKKCLFIHYDNESKEYKLNYLNNEKAIFENNCKYNFKNKAEFQFIKNPEFSYLDYINQTDTNKISKTIFYPNHLFLNLDSKYLIIHLNFRPNENNRTWIRTDNLIYKIPKENYKYYYPLTIPYDLAAGTIHTVSKPFFYGCKLSANFLAGSAMSNNLFTYTLSLPFFILTCPPSYFLLYPDCFSNPSSCN